LSLLSNKEEAVSASFISHWIVRPVIWFGGAISASLIIVMFAVTIYAIFMRYVVNKPLLWADEVTGWSLVAIVMLGAAEAYRRGDHIAIDLLSSRVPRAGQRLVAFISDLGVLGFALIVGSSTWESIQFARMFGSYTSGSVVIETWIPQTPLLIGSILLGSLASVRLLERLLGLRQ
jgi:C4-dicarboxylate transporter DctQ subunit